MKQRREILLHIPHNSVELPAGFRRQINISNKKFERFLIEITDTGTLELFGSNDFKKIVAPMSRVYCDVEKFHDSGKEIMSQFGMGVVYTHTDLGEEFFTPNSEYIDDVLQKYYFPYHKKLNEVAQNMLVGSEYLILIDCHAFAKEQIMFEEKKDNLPDICIGFSAGFANMKLIDFVRTYFEKADYSTALNYPFDGAMIPSNFFIEPPKNFASIMIEVNKELYLEKTGDIKQHGFKKLQGVINNLLLIISDEKFNN